ncbi:hypothetical protein JHK87_035692 [Glycine soja]|nr:hypothetical protein JHK87_035692 [Glycine soja]
MTQTGNGSNATPVKLRVGVPKKDGFRQFVNVVWDSHEQKHHVSGYCIDVFNAVVNLLPFKEYDVVVGDVTILANRSNFVDFTLPYTGSGVKMLVPAQHGRKQTMWIFVKPFSWDLWLSIVIISTFIGVSILIMERNVDALPHHEDSPNRTKLSPATILWFPISQAILPERQVVVKNCSRFVLMVWLLLAFVLMQSYTANLTSILTLEQLRPSFPGKGDYYVGYQTGSFVKDVLVKQFNFLPSKLRPYSNSAEYYNALKSGSQGGGVAAIFDEVPYLKVFLQEYGSKSSYILAGQTFRDDGFGFAFPLNSNLTAYFSRAILKVTESDLMKEIEEKYFGKNDDIGGEDPSAEISSATPSLNFHCFSGLFFITGISTLLALLVSETVIWQKPILIAKAYGQRYLFTAPPSTKTSVPPTHDSTHGIDVV